MRRICQSGSESVIDLDDAVVVVVGRTVVVAVAVLGMRTSLMIQKVDDVDLDSIGYVHRHIRSAVDSASLHYRLEDLDSEEGNEAVDVVAGEDETEVETAALGLLRV